MRLFIAEKPSLGRAIANGLGNPKKSDGSLLCGNDIVTWCFGHMLAQAWPQDYDPAFAQWKRDHLPIIPHKWQHNIKKEAASQLKLIGKLLKEADCVVNAGDPDREGQLLVDEVLEHFGYKGKVQRIWLASLDDISVKKAISAICDNSKFLPLRDSAIARARADWLVGINATRAMTIKGREHGKSEILSLGRVQTPTLAIVVARDKEISNFTPVDYFILKGDFECEAGNFEAVFVADENQCGMDAAGRLVDEKIAKSLSSQLQDKNGIVCESKREIKSKNAPLPHCLSSLQKAASGKLGMSAQTVLDTAQKLYEKKLTTYPRTDCQYLPEEQFEQAGDILNSLAVISGLEQIAGKADSSLKSSAWNTKKITAHHAIIPTGENAESLTSAERDVFLLIAKAYCLQFYPAMRYEAQKLVLKVEEINFEAKGRTVLENGWATFQKDEDEAPEQLLPNIEKGQSVKCKEMRIEKKKTTPPSHFTEGTLIEAMANVHRFVDDANAKTTLKEAKGIGTEATRAKILETLKEREYLKIEKKAIVSTSLGKEVIELAPQEIKDPVTTAEWESRLEAIAEGKEQLDDFLRDQCAILPDLLKSILGDSKPDFPCPKCGSPLLRRKSKKGNSWFWGCSAYPDCKIVLPDENGKPGSQKEKPMLSEFECPLCHKPLIKRKGAKGEFYGCSGYPECKNAFPLNKEGKPDFNASQAKKGKK